MSPRQVDLPDFERIDRSISVAFLGIAAGIAAAILLVVGALYVRGIRGERERLLSVVANLVTPGLESVRELGPTPLARIAARVRQADESVAYVRIIDAERVLAHEGLAGEVVARHDASAREVARPGRVVVRELAAGDSDVTELVAGLGEGASRGVLRVGFFVEPLSHVLGREGSLVGALLLALLVAAWPVSRWLGRRLGAPVQLLARDFAGVMEHTPLYVAIEDEAGAVARASEPFRRAFELAPSDHPRMAALLPVSANQALAEQAEVPVAVRGEDRRWLLARFPVLVGPNGQVLRSGVMGTDVTAWRRDQAERDRLGAAVESTDDALLVAEPGHGVVYANPAFYAKTGLERADVLGKEPAELLAGDDFARDTLRRIPADQRWRGRVSAKRVGGAAWQCDLIVSPIGGDARAQVWVARDVSRELALEAQLRQAQKMEAVGQLAGGIAHDFNNLLTVVVSSCEMLFEQPLTADQEEQITFIANAGRRATELTRQLLAFSRRQVLDIRDTELNAVVTGSLGLLRRVIGAGIELQFAPAKGLWPIRADAGQLEQVLMNLAINARDAMPEGGRLQVTTENARLEDTPAADGTTIPSGDYVVLTVADSGAGMPPDVLQRIFDPFFTTKPVGKGTGLGLATVLGIVKQSGGYIWVYSEPGRGAVFRMAFPRARLAQKGSQPGVMPAAPGQGERILVVDDEPMVRSVVSRMLQRSGYEVSMAGDGREALRRMESDGTPDLVLTDLMMPEMGGLELWNEIKQRWPALPVMFMTGYSPELVDLGARADRPEVLQKPPSATAVLAAVHRALDRPR